MAICPDKPDLHKKYFWEFRYDEIDWLKSYVMVIQRIIERGKERDWQEIIRFYGKEKVINALLNEVKFLPDFVIEEVCQYFNLKKEDLLSYKNKQGKPWHWI